MSKQTTSLKYSTVRSLNHICIYIFLHLYRSYVERCRLKRELHAELDEAPAYIRTATYTPPLLNEGMKINEKLFINKKLVLLKSAEAGNYCNLT